MSATVIQFDISKRKTPDERQLIKEKQDVIRRKKAEKADRDRRNAAIVEQLRKPRS